MHEVGEKQNNGKQESKESVVRLTIREPEMDKNFMIAFEGKTREECEAYNWAIANILDKAGFNPFHQIGTTLTGDDEPGYHAWEVWKKISRDQLEVLLPKIEEGAKEYLRDLL